MSRYYHDDSESDFEEVVYSSGDEGPERVKRLSLVPGRRKKSRSIDNTNGEDTHTGLSPRMNRMDIVSRDFTQSARQDVFFLDDGIETFCVEGDDVRMFAVREIYNVLEHRLDRAAFGAGLQSSDPAVSNLKKQLTARAAELEARLSDALGTNNQAYKQGLHHIIQWLQSAAETELREVFEGKASASLTLEDAHQASPTHVLAHEIRNLYV